jgi:tetratricopeptide (TPR) repeat protein
LDQRATLVASNANLETLLSQLARDSGRQLRLTGDPAAAPALVTVELYDRPLTQVLEYLLGSVGLDYELDPTTLKVLPALEADEASGDLLARSLATYLRASKLYPDAQEVEQALLEQGRIEVQRGHPEAALVHFNSLLDGHPDSALIPDARLEAAHLLAKLERYDEAHTLYLRVTELPLGDARRNRARLGLARCQMELSNPSFTVLMVRRLQADSPSDDPRELADRLLLLAGALERSELPVEALGSLDELERLGAPIEVQVAAMEIRARCLERLEYTPAAGRAWMVVARERRGTEAAQAYRRAAEIAATQGDALAVLFIAKEFASRGLESTSIELDSLAFDARLELGLPVDWATAPSEQQLAAARRFSSQGDSSAVDIWRALQARGEELVPAERLEVGQALARAILDEEGLDASLAILAALRPLDNAACDQLAGELCQRARDFTRASQAFLGRY